MAENLFSALSGASVLLAVKKPGIIVGFIATWLGAVFNAIFNVIYGFMQNGSLGIAIIIFTILVKLLMLPLSYKQQKSTYKMQKMQPELNRIKKKYENRKDAESQSKMNMELQELQEKNDVSLFGGCLPLLVQLPILYALFYIFQQTYLYVDVISGIYNQLAEFFLNLPVDVRMSVLSAHAVEVANAADISLDLSVSADILTVIKDFSLAQWATVATDLGTYASGLEPLLAVKTSIEYFFGIALVYRPDFSLPSVIIPVLSGVTTWLSGWLLMKKQDPETAKKNQMLTNAMPFVMVFFTFSVPAGLGVYWTVSNIYQIIQQQVLERYFKSKDPDLKDKVTVK